MSLLDKYTVPPSYTVKEAIEKMESETIKAVIVVDDSRRVLGLFSNGDMRSFFLRGGSLVENICSAMNRSPALYRSETEVERERQTKIRVVYPIIDGEGRLIKVIDGLEAYDRGMINDVLKSIPVVIMAGGKGTRLYPYTKILPKPLIPIGDMTITERIISSFRRYGCTKVYMVLNYKANMIKAYMNELERDYDIEFIEETKFLGTAGGLQLIRDKINSTFIVSNCDTLSSVDLDCVYKTHKAKGNKITLVCSMKDFVVPFGVVETDESGAVVGMREKPGYSLLVNTGLYMLEPEVLNEIGEDEFVHLPELAQRLMDKGERIGVFPVSEKSWLDMGQLAEMENMKKNLGIND